MRSMTLMFSPNDFSNSLKFLGDNSASNTTTSALALSASNLTSLTFPEPIKVAGFGLDNVCDPTPTTSNPAVLERNASSCNESSIDIFSFELGMDTPMRNTFSIALFVSLIIFIFSQNMIFIWSFVNYISYEDNKNS